MHLNKPALAALTACLTLAACRQAPRRVEASSSPHAALTVSVAPAAAVDWPSMYEAVGTVRARTSVAISSKVMGYVREVKASLGDNVAAGQLLAVLDSRDLDAAYRQAEAARAEAGSASAEADHAVASAQANLQLLKATFRRMQDLYGKKSISDQEYDEATAKLKVAQAAYDMAVSRRSEVGAKIQQTEEAVAAAGVMRSYAEIRAPFAGVVTQKQAEPGALATPGAPLFTIEQTGSFRLEVQVEESLLASTQVGQPVSVKLDAFDRYIAARVTEIVPSVDPTSRAFTVKIDLPGLPHLRSGLYGRAQFTRGTRRVIAIPAAAVFEQGQVQSVLVVEVGIARLRLVTTGQRQRDAVEILSGLNPGEQVVSPRPAALADGARVEMQP